MNNILIILEKKITKNAMKVSQYKMIQLVKFIRALLMSIIWAWLFYLSLYLYDPLTFPILLKWSRRM